MILFLPEPSGKEPTRFAFLLLLKLFPRGESPSASSQRSKFRKPLRSSRLCPNARFLAPEEEARERARSTTPPSGSFLACHLPVEEAIIKNLSNIISASKTTLLRCGTQFASYLRLIVQQRQPSAWAIKQFRCYNSTPRSEDFPKGKICFETFSIVSAPYRAGSWRPNYRRGR